MPRPAVPQVQQLFPHVSLSAIAEDLQHSGSIEATVENILEGCVHDHPAPPMFTNDELADDGPRWGERNPERHGEGRGEGEKPDFRQRLVGRGEERDCSCATWDI